MTTEPSSVIAGRAWRLLRLALLWARKGGLLRISFHKLIRKLAHSTESRRPLMFGDHEFSFDRTPIVRVKMHRPASSLPRFKMPHFPCVEPHVDFDCDFGDDEEEEEEEGIDVRAEKFIAEFYHQMKLQRQISSYLE